MSQSRSGNQADIRSKDFWNELHSSTQKTLEQIRELAQGTDLSREIAGVVNRKSQDKLLDAIRLHELIKRADTYSGEMNTWLSSNSQMLGNKLQDDGEFYLKGRNTKRSKTEADLVNDALQIIRWHETQIRVKIMRALIGKAQESAREQEQVLDCDGSAKVALLSIDASLSAWGQLQVVFPEHTDSFITLLLELDRLRRHLETEFPNARAFKRPGFDDELNLNES